MCYTDTLCGCCLLFANGYQSTCTGNSGDNNCQITIILLFLLQIVVAECEKKKEQLWITKDFSVAAQVMVDLYNVHVY